MFINNFKKVIGLIFLVIPLIYSCNSNLNYEVNYYSNGDTLSYYALADGEKNGEYRLFYEDNILKEEGFIHDGILYNVRKTFYKSGNLKSYFYYDSGVPMYEKQLDENGYLAYQSLAFKSPSRTYNKTISPGDSILLSYTLIHSMFDDPGLIFILTDLSKNDTLFTMTSDTTIIEKYIKPLNEGLNQYQISLFEVLHDRQQVTGSFIDTLDINVNNFESQSEI